MKLLKVYDENPNAKFIDTAVQALQKGEIIIYPTDTLYALGCDALNNVAIEKICRIKSMKSDKTSLSIICEDIAQVSEYAQFNNEQFKIMKENLPGPFTFIFPALSKLPKAFKGRKTVGIRIPNNNIATLLVHRLGNPIMTTSIEYKDLDYAINPELIAENYNNDASIIIDGGYGDTTPSTIIDFTEGNPVIIREGKGSLI